MKQNKVEEEYGGGEREEEKTIANIYIWFQRAQAVYQQNSI